MLREILKADRHTVYEAMDEDQLFQLMRRFDPHLAILDLHMKSIDAYAMVRPLRDIKLPRHLPVIALSPATTQTDTECIVRAGFSAFLVKPIRPFELRSCISSLLSN